LIAIHINSIRWPLSQTVSNLRTDARTASIPMIVYGPQSQEYSLQPLIERTSRSIYVASELDAVEKLHKIQKFRQTLGTSALTPELRRHQIETAVSWLAAIASGKLTTNFNLAPAEQALTDTVRQPELALDCLTALAAIPTRSSQDTMLGIVLQDKLDPEIRQASAAHLVTHIEKHSWLLDKRDVAELKRVRERETDPAVTGAISNILDALRPNSSRLVRDEALDLTPNR
jgi:hypothetical protein